LKPDIIGEIIAISRVLVSLTFTFCVHTIKHETAFLYLLSTDKSLIKITYDVHITHHTYVHGQYSGTKQNTINRHQVSDDRVENAGAFHKTLKGIKIN
jgi:hypothetical protein